MSSWKNRKGGEQVMEDEQIIQNTESDSETKKSLTPMLIVILLVFAAGVFLLQRSKKATQYQSPSSQQTDTQTSGKAKNAVVIENYSPGDEFSASVVVLESPGYLVVHEDSDGSPGEVIGKSELLPSGEGKNISVDLSRETENGEIIHAMLHTDDGDGVFQFPGNDVPVVDEEGGIVMASFLVGAGE